MLIPSFSVLSTAHHSFAFPIWQCRVSISHTKISFLLFFRADNRHNAPPEQSCFICQNSFKPTDRALFTQGRLIHDTCFYCDTCNLSLQGLHFSTFFFNLIDKASTTPFMERKSTVNPTTM